MKEILKKKGVKVALGLIGIVMAAIIVGFVVQGGREQKLVTSHLELADKFLEELDYEQAIAEYTAVLEIEPKNTEMKTALCNIYLQYADNCINDAAYNKALDVLARGYAQLQDPVLQEKLEKVKHDREELCQQLELPFKPEDIMLFGYKLTEDHFEDVIAKYGLQPWDDTRFSFIGHATSVWRGWVDGCELRAELEDDGSKWIWVQVDENAYGFSYSVQPDGEVTYYVQTDGLLLSLQDHFAGSYNLPLLSCYDDAYESWYQAVPAAKIKEIGKYSRKENDGNVLEKWIVEDPLNITLLENSNETEFYGAELSYHYSDFNFSFYVGIFNGRIGVMLYEAKPNYL